MKEKYEKGKSICALVGLYFISYHGKDIYKYSHNYPYIIKNEAIIWGKPSSTQYASKDEEVYIYIISSMLEIKNAIINAERIVLIDDVMKYILKIRNKRKLKRSK